MESKFYIGQRVVAIRDHSQGYFKKDQEFKVLDIQKGCCDYLIKITNEKYYLGMLCSCGKINKYNGVYYNQSNFAPIQEISDFTYNEAIELVTQKEKV